ncbi:MAG TPA: hypothetical protein VGG90_12290 [Candidatus Dormibacteraeota bacterium]
MNRAYIDARRPADVAREVETLLAGGCRRFILRRVAGGGFLDLERLGAGRYAAGLQATVELEGASPVPEPRAAGTAAR